MNTSDSNRPKVGIGVLIFNDDNILLGLRIGNHGANTWSPPGGYLEYGESFEECAAREVSEETGLILKKVEFYGITNNIFRNEQKHTISVFMKADYPANQMVVNKEPHNIENWQLFSMNNLPDNLFLPLKNLLGTLGVLTK